MATSGHFCWPPVGTSKRPLTDVDKSAHHAVALDREGRKLLDKALPQDEAKLRAIIAKLTKHGRLLLVVDQPATIGALPDRDRRNQHALARISQYELTDSR